MVTKRVATQQVLVVNGDVAELQATAKSLESEQIQTVCCTSATEALTAADQRSLDVAIVGSQLPDGDAFTLVKSLKLKNPQLKTIVRVASPSSESLPDMHQGTFAFVQQVDGPEELLSSVQAFDVHMTADNSAVENKLRDQVKRLTKANRKLRTQIATRKQVETKLRSDEELYRFLAENLQVAIWEVDLDGKLASINRAGLAMLGADSEEGIIGKSYLDFVPAEERNNISHLLQNAAGGSVVTFQLRTGNACHFDASFVPVPDAAGHTLRIVGTAHDITEHRLAEFASKESAVNYRSLVESTNAVLWKLNLATGQFTYIGKQVETLLGYKADTWIDMDTRLSRIHPEDRENAVVHSAESTRNGRDHDFEYRALAKDGSIVWIRDIVTVLARQDGPKELIGFMFDVTEQKRVDEALQESEKKCRANKFFLKESQRVSRIGSYDYDINSGTWRSSDVLDEIFGIQKDNGKDVAAWLKVVHPDMRQEMQNYLMKDVLIDHQRFDREYRIIRASDHEVRYVHGLGELDFDDDGKPTGLIGTIQDITERKLAEEKLLFTQFAVDHNADPTYCVRADGKICYVNEAACRTLGYSREELQSMVVPDISTDLSQDAWSGRWQKIRDGEAMTLETHHKTKSGQALPVEIHTSFIQYQNEEYAWAYARDITERKRAEVALTESEQRYRRLFEDSPISLWEEDFTQVQAYLAMLKARGVTDYRAYFAENPDEVAACAQKVRILDVNKATLTLHHAENKERLLGDLTTTFTEKTLEAFREELITLAEGRTRFEAEAEVKTLTGENRNVHLDFSVTQAVRDGSDRMLALVAIADITERKHTEARLRFTQFAVDHNADPTYWVSADGKICYVNDAACRTLGYSREELQSMTVPQIDPDFPVEAWPGHWQEMKDAGSLTFEAHHKTKSGQVIPVEIHTSFITYQNEEYIWAFVHDITERKQAEERITRFSRIFEDSLNEIYLFDADALKFTQVNGAAQHNLGYTMEELHELTPLDLKPEVTNESFAKLVAPLRNGEKDKIVFETVHKRKDQSLYNVEVHLQILHFEHETLFAAIISDITERKQAQEQLNKLSVALEQIPAAVIITDISGTIEYVNPRFTQINGYRAEEVIGKSPRMLDPDGCSGNNHKQVWDVITSGKTWRGEFHNQKKNGRQYCVSASISPVRNTNDEITHFLVVEEDITAKKLVAKEKANLTEQLWHAQKMETVGTLAGGIAHDFNNILQAIQGYVDMCMDELPPDGPVYRDLNEVMKATGRAAKMVKQLLAFSRNDYQERERVEMPILVNETLHLLRGSLPSTIDIRPDIVKKCNPIMANPGQIHQVIMNLCTNAYQSMGLDGGTLAVKLRMAKIGAAMRRRHPQLVADAYLELSVTDTGKGMDSRTLDRIFEPFFTTKQVGEGTGLGLSVVHGIVLAHDGHVVVKSEPETGTSILVYLPVVEPSDRETACTTEVAVEYSGRILYVDDEASVATVVTRLLTKLGYDVVASDTGHDALTLFRKDPGAFDLVLTDQTMPGMTGIKLAEKLLKIRPAIPIILMSGFGRIGTHDDAKKLGIREFVMKPVMADELSAAINRVLQTDHSNRT